MAEQTSIGWTATVLDDGTIRPGATFNAWWGCVKVSPGCQNCYALDLSKRYGHDIWGPATTTSRRFFGEKHWAEPFKWNRDAEAAGVRRKVFTASMSDVFEEHPDVGSHRDRLFRVIEATPWLDWLVLTKRPENVNRMIPETWHNPTYRPLNWWQGTSVENQAAADERIPYLLATPAAVRFLSCEPLLGPVNLERPPAGSKPDPQSGVYPPWYSQQIDWVIVGGESGPKHREMLMPWLVNLVHQCKDAGVPIYVKQDSGLYPGRQGRIPDDLWRHEWPEPAASGQDVGAAR